MTFKERFARFFDITFWKFLLVGAANTLFGAAVMFVFYNVLGLSYWISSASNYVFGSILSYFLNKYFTFRSRSPAGNTLLRFALCIGLCYLVSYGLARPAVRLVFSSAGQKLRDNLAMLAGMAVFTALNYCGQRFFVFRRDGGGDGSSGQRGGN